MNSRQRLRQKRRRQRRGKAHELRARLRWYNRMHPLDCMADIFNSCVPDGPYKALTLDRLRDLKEAMDSMPDPVFEYRVMRYYQIP